MTADLSRRAFLGVLGGSGMLLALGPGEKFVHRLIPYINPPLYPQPGEWAFYATTCRECPAGCGLLMWHRDGRVTKAEGNPLHTINRGKICIRGQSSVQGQYDPDRLQTVMKKDAKGNFHESNWQHAMAAMKRELSAGKKPIVITDVQTGSLAEEMAAFTDRFNGQLLYYEAFNYEALQRANEMLYGKRLIPRYDLANSDLIISLGADFLETWLSPVEYAGDFSRLHTLRNKNMGRSIYVGQAATLTAVNADEFVNIPAGSEAAWIYALIEHLRLKGGIKEPKYLDFLTSGQGTIAFDQEQVGRIAEQLMQARSPLVLAGSPLDGSAEGIHTVRAATLLNALTGSPDLIDFSQYHALSKAAYKSEVHDLLGSVSDEHLLIFHNTNPVYSEGNIAGHIGRAAKVAYIGTQPNETSALADWLLPSHHPLESWGDYEAWKGTISLQQPAMQPLFDSRAAGDIFMQLTGTTPGKSFKEKVRENWLGWSPDPATVEEDPYQSILRKGHIEVLQQAESSSPNLSSPVAISRKKKMGTGAFSLRPLPSLFFYDGRLANRSWLQEIPHPVSNIAWQSWVDMHPHSAAELNIAENDVVTISSRKNSLEVAVRLTEDIDRNTLAVEVGRGHWSMGRTADGIGVNAFSLLADDGEDTEVKIEKTGQQVPLLYLLESKEQNGRELLKAVKLDELAGGTAQREEINWPLPRGYDEKKDLYEPHEHKEHRWGMTIDLQSCIGCKACEAACYAENNIPVVGKKNCEEGREMSWLKVASYRLENKQTAFMPVPCQHCDAAPCEPVCPTFASVHNEEGLNAQIYNRCIGTRYCSNNCPYKVRRFNWSNISHDFPLNLQLNPEVSVRSRGVMEKCTFCIQRIKQVEYQAKKEQRTIEDGEIVPACAQTCPTGAIVFGDLMDEDSQVMKLMKNERRYQLLKELNTKPAVVYLKKITS